MNKHGILTVILLVGLLIGTVYSDGRAEDLILNVVDERSGISHSFSFEEISRYNHHSIDTTTPWTDGVSRFDGTLLKLFLLDVVSSFKTLVVTAYNDYSAEIKFTDLDASDVLLAWSLDGKQLRLEDKGPYWIVFDLDSLAPNDSKYLNKMVWQVKSINVVE